jgi:hypothetical protein
MVYLPKIYHPILQPLYVKDESSNSNTMTSAFKHVMKCEAISLVESFFREHILGMFC